jgi:hypothetical protein
VADRPTTVTGRNTDRFCVEPRCERVAAKTSRRWALRCPEHRRVHARNAQRNYQRSRPEQTRQYADKWRQLHPDRIVTRNPRFDSKAYHTWWKYTLTEEDYAELLASQNGKCAVCLTVPPDGNPRNGFHVDHDHACCPGRRSCGRCVRGLLCGECNRALGMLHDDSVRIRALAEYADRFAGGVSGHR